LPFHSLRLQLVADIKRRHYQPSRQQRNPRRLFFSEPPCTVCVSRVCAESQNTTKLIHYVFRLFLPFGFLVFPHKSVQPRGGLTHELPFFPCCWSSRLCVMAYVPSTFGLPNVRKDFSFLRLGIMSLFSITPKGKKEKGYSSLFIYPHYQIAIEFQVIETGSQVNHPSNLLLRVFIFLPSPELQ